MIFHLLNHDYLTKVTNVANLDLPNRPPELSIGPIKYPKSSILILFFLLLNSYNFLNI